MTQPAAETLEREKDKLTSEVLRDLLIYEPDTGVFRKKPNHQQLTNSGASRYQRIYINGIQYYAHRLAWLYVYGEWPPHEVDHINGDPRDNRMANLRLATHRENMANVKKHRDNGSGFKGAYPTRHNTWLAKIMKNGKVIRLGHFKTKEEAHAAYRAAAEKFHGEFGRHE